MAQRSHPLGRASGDDLGVAQFALFLLESGSRTFHIAGSNGFGAGVVERAGSRLVFRLGEERGIVGLVGARMQSVYVPNVLSERRWVSFDASLRCAYFVPIIHADSLLGVLAFYACKADAFSTEHREFADAYAAQIGQLLSMATRLGGRGRTDELIQALFSSDARNSPARNAHRLLSALSLRELEVVAILRRGLRISQIATTLSISTHTARNHIKHIYRKLGVHSQVELLAMIEAEDTRFANVGEASAQPSERPASILAAVHDTNDLASVEVALAKAFPAAQITTVYSMVQLRAIVEQPFDVLVIDLGMGSETKNLVAAVRMRAARLVVLVLADQAKSDLVVATLHAGADNYLFKVAGFADQLKGAIEHATRERHGRLTGTQTPLRVLYAEDNPADADLTLRHLARHAPTVQLQIVRTPEELLRRLPAVSGTPLAHDVVLLDFRLPGLNALELLRILRTDRKLRIPIIVVTANSDGRLAAQAFSFGASEYIVKHPGYLYALPAFLEKACGRTEAQNRTASPTPGLTFRLQEALELIPDAVVVIDVHGFIHAVNDGACSMFRALDGELIGRCADELLPTDKRPAHAAWRHENMAASTLRSIGRHLTATCLGRRADGTTFCAEVALGPLHVGVDNPLVLAVVRDIDERSAPTQRARAHEG